MRLKLLIAGLAAATFALPAAAQKTVAPQDVLNHYGQLVHASYADSASTARTLKKAVDAFVEAPSEAGLIEARKRWLEAREWYGQTEAFRFYGGPIDGEDGPEGRINAWPMDEAYVDSVEGNPDTGIINDRSVKLDAETLAGLNEKDGEENISTGWHAIEFLLWGQDLSADGPGNRAWTDFVDGKAPNADRRRAYLQIVTDLLIEDLDGLVQSWAPGGQNYRASFLADPASLTKVISALGILSRAELAGERIEVALDSQSQEDEHSCFSDNTHRDAVANALGIRNVWRGEFVRADGSLLKGPSLNALVASKDKALAGEVDARMSASLKAAEAIPAPFDQAILAGNPGRPKVEATVTSLKSQTETLVQAAEVLGIKRLNTALPE
ncbi:imelysin family protein [Thauera linaloolentis]|uniref:Peptidase M75, Imelysin n=1 Tax=Thauera linaloolentis (strain DSM 12138 / JCM 21573 / CCUG 41526 / CIP 105981 / IAM 15112 / NBRC 102519 / 47Lol) TaxID=1123367 RepID=N6YAU7_THAL4|nr:imelysin family protein [Thauera linaloolentis]ENO88650.1 peptidase M75, Imelysin [Thauera linaloolentis 47Lol = DSM 12138]MCM8565695.1 iron-regulated protein [Thauera linaloolentis]